MKGTLVAFSLLIGAATADITNPESHWWKDKMPPAVEESPEVLYQMANYQCSTDSDCLAYCSFKEQRECTDEDIFGPPCSPAADDEEGCQ